MIPLSIPNIGGNEWKYIKSCLDTNWVSTAGQYVQQFEQTICEYNNVKNAIGCVNGTSALHIALHVVGVKTDDEVIVPTLTFIAPVNVIRYVHARPVFMDCDRYYNIDIEKCLDFISNETVYKNGKCINKKTGNTISAIIPVHVFGNAVDLEPLINMCQEYNIKIVEDATESLGSMYVSGRIKNQYTGTIGDIGIYSFNGNKIITTGGGGMIVTNRDQYGQQARYFTTQAKDDEIKYIHNEIGYNYRLTNIQAALGVAQLEQLDNFIEIKKRNFEYYRNILSEIPGLILNDVPDYAHSNYWFYAIQLDREKFPLDRDGLMHYLNDKNIQTRPVWYLNHWQKPYKNFQFYKIENAVKKLESTLNFPCSTSLTSEEINYIGTTLKSLFK